ncbi:LOW QUALITY PROTEIN: uncharacterized protein LOC130756229 [Actinidia eriantha]|uniref:LOW QUALITY PROTEIN: uncharacterized protein LOC130756229 n=1 Tax=Actinidia eriantha TaxID=165200 RepID=UPI00258F671A|nr:LOW QUALITY PROTEIN: uncharacterized protein LOC130756229 [Actinidia eriantha]
MYGNSGGQQLLMPNKNVIQIEPFSNNPGLQQLASLNKRPIQLHSKSITPGPQNLSTPNKKIVRNESISGRSGTKQLQTPKNQTTQMEPSPRVQTESFESVRSKMRESLASALALGTQVQAKASNVESNSGNSQQTHGDSQHAESASVLIDGADNLSANPTDSLPLEESSSLNKANDVQSTSLGNFTSESMGDSAQSWNGGRELQCDTFLPNEDVSFDDSFFVRDELLQGNGLTWALDVDVDAGQTMEEQIAKKPKLDNEDAVGEGKEQVGQSPQSLAFKIEAELFKLFGGVNKKYKEKGRSLLFNLKDRNNPELRERVMSGEIPPERLCSMTAEELASKELSQWRMAKAEEFAQMVVLPDSDVDVRRLVKKTHKGEFQVEFEQDDGVSVEVSIGTSSLTRVQSKNNDTEAHPSDKGDEIKEKENVIDEKRRSENQGPYNLTIPSDGTDLIEGLMVDDFKDAEFLPPIVSLDEFMESLNAEPPFENLPVDVGKTISPSDKESSEGGYAVTPPDLASREPAEGTQEKSDKIEVMCIDSDVKTKSRETSIEPKPSPGAASKVDHVWEGVLQLNVSAMVTVIGFFRSGEKISTKDWPSSLEIKGRVRLDAFEKFFQGLPMSRSRAVMVVHFALKEGSSENDHASLGEVVQSYVSDERLGFAEPTPGVEIYFCPPHPNILEMLTKHLSKGHSHFLNSKNNDLIGIIVWRRSHLSTSATSPKYTSKRQHNHFTTRKHHQEEDSYMNVKNFASKQPNLPMGDDDGDDDIPPGFGPGATREEDDLPEFNFSGVCKNSKRIPSCGLGTMTPFRPNSSVTPRSVDQMKELVQKYGQIGNSVSSRNGIRPWNDDDEDDDIPEWQPQAPTQHHLPPPPHLHLHATFTTLCCPIQGRQCPGSHHRLPL